MTFKLPELPYAYDALAPVHVEGDAASFTTTSIIRPTSTTATRSLGPARKYDGKSIEDICKEAFAAKNAPVINNIGQHYNHIHFWQWMKKGGGGKKLPGKLQAMVDKDLGGYDKMRADFVQAGVTQFGSGWAWLAVKDGKLAGRQDANGENPLMHGATPILGRRRVGAQLLHRLPQRAAEVPRSLVRQPGELGARRGHARQGEIAAIGDRLGAADRGRSPSTLTGRQRRPRRLVPRQR